MALNGISTLTTKQAKQIAKLELASAKRQAQGKNTPYYDITLLPTQYIDNSVSINTHVSGLVIGRPWVSSNIGGIEILTTDSGDTLITDGGDTLILG